MLAARRLSVEQLLTLHWREFGRNFFTRYDYEVTWTATVPSPISCSYSCFQSCSYSSSCFWS